MEIVQRDITGGVTSISSTTTKKALTSSVKKPFLKIDLEDAVNAKQADSNAMLILRMMQKKALYKMPQSAELLESLVQCEMDVKAGLLSASTAARTALLKSNII